ncbi:SET domain-containing protein [Auricularia subglabra TFB-10046 SS5]|uniref:SET domain-containing protein n=1 Tax=Auricularia subglabra (strain TFB-10046 / SS5) TaxID=717982 RepID=J0D4C0_AURST|nr:SET domain-containing protein [Auricularia subglabra TFB-10046 SS5]
MASDSRRDEAVSVYEQTWRDFYQWEQQSARELLGRLDPDVDSLESETVDSDDSDGPRQELKPEEPEEVQRQTQTDEGYIQVFDDDFSMTTRFSKPSLRCPTARPSPRYESCDLLISNVFLGHADRPTWPRAIQFADDPSFNTDEYLHGLAGADMEGVPDEERSKLFRQLKASQPTGPEDPNLDAIELETLRRLRVAGFPTSEIQHHAILSNDPSHLILHSWQRELPPWPVLTQLGSQFQALAKGVVFDTGGAIMWDEDELDSLALIVSQCPSIDVCQLAVTMDRPCCQVFIQRRELPKRNPEIFKPRPPREVVSKEDAFGLPVNGKYSHSAFGCSHTGPCTLQHDCACAKFGHYCQTACSCTQECGRQYQGCDCRASSQSAVCRTPQSCLCMRLARECEPGVCKGCLTHEGRQRCSNRVLGGVPLIKYKVAESKHGYGLFAREKITSKQAIGEYVAEVISPERTDSQCVIARHVERNYLFDWCEEEGLFLDSLEAGNATRFINHADGRKANASAIYKWVNGDVKLGIYAIRNIRKNQEILMNYGQKYFLSGGEEEQEEHEDAHKREISLAL